jgi:E3 ubiquitin-protein ligase MYCBP2
MTTTTCPSCSTIFEYIECDELTNSAQKNKTIIGREMSEIAKIHYNINRIKCTNCNTVYCKKCTNVSYHTGYTCVQYEEYLKSDKYRYCLNAVDENGCIECKKYGNVCKKVTLDCEHYNHGFNEYDLCLKCNGIYDDYCGICITDKLRTGPCIELDCGHIFHLQCVKNKLNSSFPTEYISFNYVNCSMCSYRMSHPALNLIMKDIQQDYKIIEQNIIEIVKEEQIDKKITDVRDDTRFYKCNKCDKCDSIYFGGMANCIAENNLDQNNNNKCPKCSTIGKTICDKHGKDYVLYKCCFCCNVFVWDCGSALFCQPCHIHLRQTIIPCPGTEKCILGTEHPENKIKNRFAIGCSLCLPNKFKNRLKWSFKS